MVFRSLGALSITYSASGGAEIGSKYSNSNSNRAKQLKLDIEHLQKSFVAGFPEIINMVIPAARSGYGTVRHFLCLL